MAYKPVPYNRDKMLREIMKDPEARAIYEATKLQIDLSIKLKKARIKRKMTQDDVAEIMHTKKPSISRIESVDVNNKHFPSLLTLAKFAAAIGCELKINLAPIKKSRKSDSDDARTK